MNRYECDDLELVVEGLGSATPEAFGSATDLGTGIERPLALHRDGASLVARIRGCAARTLVRVYWPLERS